MVGGKLTRTIGAGIGAWVVSAAFVSTAMASNDPLYSQQWALNGAAASIRAPQAWCTSTGGVLVADVDTGADLSHPDLAGRLVAGARFTDGTGTQSAGAVQDGFGHGTMTTGLMVAIKDNGVGIAGVAPSSQALIVKVLDDTGKGFTNDIGAGIRYAVDHGARVINLSLGPEIPLVTSAFDTSIPDAITYAAQHNVAVAAAAGNNSLPVSDYQSVANVALVVGALNRSGAAASYSTSGVGVNIWAPGGDGPGGDPTLDIVSTYKDAKYAAQDGTSFAAPQVAGTLALLISKGMSVSQARQQILNTAVTRNSLPELDASRAIGSSSGCAGVAPAPNNSRPGAGSPPSGPSPGPPAASNAQGAPTGTRTVGTSGDLGGGGVSPLASPAGGEAFAGLGQSPSPGHNLLAAPPPPRNGSPPVALVVAGLFGVVMIGVVLRWVRPRT